MFWVPSLLEVLLRTLNGGSCVKDILVKAKVRHLVILWPVLSFDFSFLSRSPFVIKSLLSFFDGELSRTDVLVHS